MSVQLARAELIIAEVTDAAVGATTLEALDLAAASWLESGSSKEIEDALTVAYDQYLVDLPGSRFEWFVDENARGREYLLRGPSAVDIHFWRAARNRLRTGGELTFAILAALHAPLVQLTASVPQTEPVWGTPVRKAWWVFWR